MTIRGAHVGGAPNSFNALTASSSGSRVKTVEYMGINPVYTPLGVPDYNLTVVDWIHHNNNYTEWTINIKPGAKWSDGTPITSADILATYSSKFAFNASYDFTGVHTEVASEYALNSSAAVFNLNKPDATFPVTIGQQVLTGVYPAKYITAPTTTFFNAPDSGAFYSVGYATGSTIDRMVRNPYYSPAPVPCELDYSFPESASTVASLLIGGSLDFGPIAPGDAASVLAHPNLHVFDQKENDILPMMYNTTLYPFNMTVFRQALVYGINENAIASSAFSGYATAAYGSEGTIPPIYSWYDKSQMQYNFNQTMAQQLLSSIGLNKGSNGMLQFKNGTALPSFTIWVGTDLAPSLFTTAIVQQDLQQLGISTTVKGATWGTIFSQPTIKSYQINIVDNDANVWANPQIDALPGWDVFTVPPIISKYWMYPSSANNNYNGNLSIIDSTTNINQVKQALNNIQALGAEYLPVIPLVYYDHLYGYSTARWVNWPTYPQSWFYQAGTFDDALFSQLKPASASSVSSSSSPSTSTSTVTSTSISTSTSTAVSTSVSTSLSTATSTTVSTSTVVSTAAAPSSGTSFLIAAVVVVIAIIAAMAAVAMRRRRPEPTRQQQR